MTYGLINMPSGVNTFDVVWKVGNEGANDATAEAFRKQLSYIVMGR